MKASIQTVGKYSKSQPLCTNNNTTYLYNISSTIIRNDYKIFISNTTIIVCTKFFIDTVVLLVVSLIRESHSQNFETHALGGSQAHRQQPVC